MERTSHILFFDISAWSSLIGTFLPLLASKLKLDPAIIASPALTTIVDITGLLIYFTNGKMAVKYIDAI